MKSKQYPSISSCLKRQSIMISFCIVMFISFFYNTSSAKKHTTGEEAIRKDVGFEMPVPTAMATPIFQSICSGSAITTIVVTGNATSFRWQRDNTGGIVTGIGASGTGDISGTLTLGNSNTLPITVTFTITPKIGNDEGTPIIAKVLVLPIPTVNTIANQTICKDNVTNEVNFTAGISGSLYSWTNSNTAIGLAASGFGDIPSFTATNTTNAPITGTITVTPITNSFAYIISNPTNSTDDDSVFVINTTNNQITAKIKVGANPQSLSVSPDGSKIYVANSSDNNVSVINTATNTVSATIPVGSNPFGLAVSTDGSKLYVANLGSDLNSDSVSVINTANNTLEATVKVGIAPWSISVNPNGLYVYVSNSFAENVSVINASTNTVETTVSVGSSPLGIATSPDGSKIYVANYSDNNVSVINTATNTVSATIDIGTDYNPINLVVSPDGTRLYVANDGNGTVSVINASDNTKITDIETGNNPFGVSVSPDGTKLYVANYSSDTVSIINTSNNSILTSLVVRGPGGFGNFITPTPVCSGSSKSFTITVNVLSAVLAGNSSRQLPINAQPARFFSEDCKVISTVSPNGLKPVKGRVTSTVAVDASVGTINGDPFVQRRYNITPVANANEATARITLYFEQSEFDAYNSAKPSRYPALPSHPTDISGKSNLRITQDHDISVTPRRVLINPNDNDIVWNSTSNWWEVSFDVNGFSDFYLHGATPFDAPLPVNLVSFSGQRLGAKNILHWTTANEENNRGFEVQYSTDGISYNIIGFVNSSTSNGNSNVELRYTFEHNNPSGKTQYYRLRQVDNDGKSKFSNIVLIKSDKAAQLAISSLIPNPASNQLNILIDAPARDNVTLVVTDVSGKQMLQKQVNLEIGSNTVTLDVSAFAKGTYFVKMFCNGNCENQVSKFLKQ